MRIFCPNCGNPIDLDTPTDHVFCPNCGTRIDLEPAAGAEPPPPNALAVPPPPPDAPEEPPPPPPDAEDRGKKRRRALPKWLEYTLFFLVFGGLLVFLFLVDRSRSSSSPPQEKDSGTGTAEPMPSLTHASDGQVRSGLDTSPFPAIIAFEKYPTSRDYCVVRGPKTPPLLVMVGKPGVYAVDIRDGWLAYKWKTPYMTMERFRLACISDRLVAVYDGYHVYLVDPVHKKKRLLYESGRFDDVIKSLHLGGGILRIKSKKSTVCLKLKNGKKVHCPRRGMRELTGSYGLGSVLPPRRTTVKTPSGKVTARAGRGGTVVVEGPGWHKELDVRASIAGFGMDGSSEIVALVAAAPADLERAELVVLDPKDGSLLMDTEIPTAHGMGELGRLRVVAVSGHHVVVGFVGSRLISYNIKEKRIAWAYWAKRRHPGKACIEKYTDEDAMNRCLRKIYKDTRVMAKRYH